MGRLLLGGLLLLLALSSLAMADMIVGGLVHQRAKGKDTLAAEGVSVTETKSTFSFSEQLFQMNYDFTINGNQLVDSDGSVAGTFGPEGFEFTHHYNGSTHSCVDHYKVLKLLGSALYYNSYTCTDGTSIVDKGTLYPYGYPY